VGDEAEGGCANALALLTLLAVGEGDSLAPTIKWLLKADWREASLVWRWKIQKIDNRVKFDPVKYGWSWVPGTTRWVIPAAFSVIALRPVQDGDLSRRSLSERADEHGCQHAPRPHVPRRQVECRKRRGIWRRVCSLYRRDFDRYRRDFDRAARSSPARAQICGVSIADVARGAVSSR